MKEVKPTKSKKRKVELPTQQSANDTSNWENRNISAATLDKTRTKRIVRQVDFIKPTGMEGKVLTLDQVRKLLAEQGLTEKEIEQRLQSRNSPKKSS